MQHKIRMESIEMLGTSLGAWWIKKKKEIIRLCSAYVSRSGRTQCTGWKEEDSLYVHVGEQFSDLLICLRFCY